MAEYQLARAYYVLNCVRTPGMMLLKCEAVMFICAGVMLICEIVLLACEFEPLIEKLCFDEKLYATLLLC